MSFWDRYLAPGDVRHAHLPTTSPTTPNQPEDAPRLAKPPIRIDAATRQRRQDAILYGGIFFTALSLFITRRSLRRKLLPGTVQQNTAGVPLAAGTAPGSEKFAPKTDGPLDAVEALGLATLNVFSFAMLAAGSAMKIFDIADIEDMRDGVRRGVGFDVYGGESEADKEMEGWIADVLARKDGTGDLRGEIVGKLAEMEGKERERRARGEAR
ncbi:hypothetical protein LTR62_002225 [Meristemomyces frigidus]|uniref:Altered inheritance of mitochondria protein 11 n=1 Tax=Meristemomyces frigidus TaxID=1508187 RepID=A0AAN7TMD5_9PEZI|nr:hypothetical protein LTR62_002225 [Meristemomyces frigidus]